MFVEKHDGRTYPHEALEHYRFQAVRLRKEGWNVNEIAHVFSVHRGSVSRWLTTNRRDGRRALASRKATGRPRILSPAETKRVLAALHDDATKHGFETPLWTCKRVGSVMREETGKSLHETSVFHWLKRWGLTNQAPRRRAKEQDPAAVKRWLREEWPRIRAHAKRWQAMLYFQDESGVSLTAVLGKTWGWKGKTPVIGVTGKRGGFCVTSAISPAGRMVFRIEKGRVDAAAHVEFLQQILDTHPRRKVIVVEDRAGPHTAMKVDAFEAQNAGRFAIYRLPPYSPELNPDEHVWAYLKAHRLKAHQAKNTDELRGLVRGKMGGMQQRKGLVRSFFAGTYVT